METIVLRAWARNVACGPEQRRSEGRMSVVSRTGRIEELWAWWDVWRRVVCMLYVYIVVCLGHNALRGMWWANFLAYRELDKHELGSRGFLCSELR